MVGGTRISRSERALLRVVSSVGSVENGRTAATKRARGAWGHVAPPKAIRSAIIRTESPFGFPSSELTQGKFDEHCGSHANDGAHYSSVCTVRGIHSAREVLEEAPIAGLAGCADAKRCGNPANCGALYMRTLLQVARIVDKELRREVVGALDDQVDRLHQVARIVRKHAGANGHMMGGGVGAQPAECSDPRIQLVLSHVGLAVKELPMQIRFFDHIVFRDQQRADASSGKTKSGRTS